MGEVILELVRPPWSSDPKGSPTSLLDATPTNSRQSNGAGSNGAGPVVARADIEVIEDVRVETSEQVAARYTFAIARVALGFVFLWAFIDKLVGLDHATPSARAWINGGSPSTGFLSGVEGPFADVFHSIAGTPADALFMAGLLGIGVALTLGIGMRVAAAAAAPRSW